MSSTFKRMLGRAEATGPRYVFHDDDDKVVKFPTSIDEMLSKQAEIERLLVDCEGEYQFVVQQYNELIDHHNEMVSRMATKLAEHGVRAVPVLKPRKEFTTTDTPPSIPEVE